MTRKLIICLLLICTITSLAHAYPSFGTVMVSGSAWCQGLGVDVYSDGPEHGYYPDRKSYVNGEYIGVQWQCVELPRRLYEIRGWHSSAFGIMNAYEIWGRASALNMQQKPRGSGYIPVPGDMMVFNPDSPGSGGSGHVSVVDRVDGSTLYVCEQNADATGGRSYNLNSLPSYCYGFVHDPDNPLTNCTAANVTWTSTPSSGWYNTDRHLTYSVGGTSPVNVVESPAGMWVSGLGQGWHDYSVTVSNCGGSDSKHWQGGWDTVTPITNFSGPATSTWLNTGSSVVWNPSDGMSGIASSSLLWDNGSTNAQIPEGIHSVTVSATDNAGNIITETRGPYWLDTVVPSITLNGPTTSDCLNTAQTISWNVSDATSGLGAGYPQIQWDDGTPDSISASGSMAIPEGKHSVVIIAEDVAGNVTTKTGGPWCVDTSAPTAPVVETPAESGSLDTLAASWSSDDPQSGISDYEYRIGTTTGGNEVLGDTSSEGKKYAQVEGLSLTDGVCYYFSVHAKNCAGMWSGWANSACIKATQGNKWYSFNTGGVTVARTSETMGLVDSIGEFVVGTASSDGLILESGFWHSDTSDTPVFGIGEAKSLPDATNLILGDFMHPMVVTAGTGILSDRLYVEQPDRSSGIAVKPISLQTSVSEGDYVTVNGQLETVDGERALKDAQATLISNGQPLKPMLMIGKNIGGADLNTLTPGVFQGKGLNNIGLLIQAYGGFGYIDGSTFTINDGSGVIVKCVVPVGVTLDSKWKHVIIIGISSTEKVGTEIHRLIRVRTQDDIIGY